MKFIYPAIFTQEKDGITVTFPDLEGCITWGETLTSAFVNAEEALSLYLEPDTDEPQFPQASDCDSIRPQKNQIVQLVSADVKVSMGKSVKKTLTIPSWLNNRAESANINFSQELQEALKKKLGI